MSLPVKVVKDDSPKKCELMKTEENKRKLVKFNHKENDNSSTSGDKTVLPSEAIANQFEKLNNYVLGHIFSFLDLESLKNCRLALVSTEWNEEASLQLSEKAWFKLLWEKIHLRSVQHPRLSQSEFEEARRDRNNYGQQKRKELAHCIKSLSNPSLFVNFEFDFEWMTNRYFPNILENFGSTLKRITIRDRNVISLGNLDLDKDYAKRMSIVCKSLKKWCPRLTTFEMEVFRRHKEVILYSPQMKWGLNQPNNIRELRMEGLLTEYLSEIWIRLIKACPSLTTLSVSCIPDRVMYIAYPVGDSMATIKKRDSICESFLEKLAKLPEVLQKLEDFSWNGPLIDKWYCPYSDIYRFYNVEQTSCNVLKPVSNMEFSNKLKHIGIGPSVDSWNGNERHLTLLLKKLNACGTQHIVLNGNYELPLPPGQIENNIDEPDESKCECKEDEHKLECFSRVDHIPLMPKVTSIKSFAKDNYKMGAIHFVHKFPNLKMFEMPQEFDNEKLYPQADDFERELQYMCQFPHYNLRKLTVKPTVNKPTTLEYIVKSFPNLRSLHFQVGNFVKRRQRRLRLDEDEPVPPPQNELSFKQALDISSKGRHLKELTVTFLSEYSPADLCEALGVVKNFPKLEFLTLNGFNCNPKISFSNIEGGLPQLANLSTSVSLVGYKVTRFDTIQMEKYCEKNHIRAKFVPDVEKKFPDMPENL